MITLINLIIPQVAEKRAYDLAQEREAKLKLKKEKEEKKRLQIEKERERELERARLEALAKEKEREKERERQREQEEAGERERREREKAVLEAALKLEEDKEAERRAEERAHLERVDALRRDAEAKEQKKVISTIISVTRATNLLKNDILLTLFVTRPNYLSVCLSVCLILFLCVLCVLYPRCIGAPIDSGDSALSARTSHSSWG